MMVVFFFQLSMELKYVVHQRKLKLLDISLITFSAYKLLPGKEQILNWNDIVVGMRESIPEHNTKKNAPPLDSFTTQTYPCSFKT